MGQSVETIFNLFSPISLQEMDGVKLMDRTDTKFVFTKEQLHLPPNKIGLNCASGNLLQSRESLNKTVATPSAASTLLTKRVRLLVLTGLRFLIRLGNELINHFLKIAPDMQIVAHRIGSRSVW